MGRASAGGRFTAGLVVALTLTTTGSVAAAQLQARDPWGLGAALFVAILAVVALFTPGWRLAACGALLGVAIWAPAALAWAVDHGMSLGG